jgi:hypothetical protein
MLIGPVIRKLGWATDLWDRQHNRSLPLLRNFGAHKNMVKDMGQHRQNYRQKQFYE